MSEAHGQDHRLPPFVWVDAKIPRRYRKALGAAGLGVYLMLASYRNRDRYCWPSLETLCNDLDMCRKTLKKYLAKLQDLGLIKMEEGEFCRDGRRWQGYLFTLLDVPLDEGMKNSQGSNVPLGESSPDGSEKVPIEQDPREQEGTRTREDIFFSLDPEDEEDLPTPPVDDHPRATSDVAAHEPPAGERQPAQTPQGVASPSVTRFNPAHFKWGGEWLKEAPTEDAARSAIEELPANERVALEDLARERVAKRVGSQRWLIRHCAVRAEMVRIMLGRDTP